MIPFEAINSAALSRYPRLLEIWLPGGRLIGREYTCANLQGGPGDSMKVNIVTGAWADFASDDRGGDPISLHAAIHGLGQGDAARELAREFGIDIAHPITGKKIAAVYDYRNAAGTLVFQVVRYRPKDFRQRRPDGKDGWVYNMQGVKPVPYRLPAVLSANTVFIVEGEKDVDALTRIGLTATCNAMGAGKWTSEHASYLRGKQVRIIPDNDDAGRKHAMTVARSLEGIAAEVKVVNLPNLPHKGDVSDWLANGGTKEELLRIVDAFSEWSNGVNTRDCAQDSAKQEVDIATASVNEPCACGGGNILPPPPAPPMHCLPPTFHNAVNEAANAFCVNPVVPFAAFLVLASGCIGYTRRIKAKHSWKASANIYMALIGRSGTGKSPCTNKILSPLFKEERRRAEQYRMEMDAFERDCELWKSLKPKDRREMEQPIEPEWSQLTIDDATLEAVAVAMLPKKASQTPHRGLLWIRDELSGLLLDMDRYATTSKGATKARLLTAYDVGPWKVNRATKKRPEYIAHACISIFGTIQPGILDQAFDKTDALSGLLPRFIFIRVEQDRPATWTNDTFSSESDAALNSLAGKLLKYDFENEYPVDICLSDEAIEIYRNWHDEQALEAWNDPRAATFEALSAKLRGQCLRFALILHCVWAVDAGVSERSPISRQTMLHAIELANWVKVHQLQSWQLMGYGEAAKEALPIDKRVARAIVALEPEIHSGMLATSRITVMVNAGCAENFRMKPDAVGRVLAKLELAPYRSKDHRGVRISPGVLDRLRGLIGSSEFAPAGPREKQGGTAPHRTSGAVTGDGINEPSTSVTAATGYNNDLNDACDGGDAFVGIGESEEVGK